MFSINGTTRQSINLKMMHGSGGSAPVTKGVIDTARQGPWLPDADIVWNGHNHQGYIVPIARERLTASGRVSTDIVWHVRTPGYKREWGDGTSGFAVERLKGGPSPLGAVWLHFVLRNKSVAVRPIPEIEA
jgi:hypothetical protein